MCPPSWSLETPKYSSYNTTLVLMVKAQEIWLWGFLDSSRFRKVERSSKYASFKHFRILRSFQKWRISQTVFSTDSPLMEVMVRLQAVET